MKKENYSKGEQLLDSTSLLFFPFLSFSGFQFLKLTQNDHPEK